MPGEILSRRRSACLLALLGFFLVDVTCAIAHRLSTLRSFDRIVVLDRGCVVQDGPPDELLRQVGPYRALVDGELARLQRAA